MGVRGLPSGYTAYDHVTITAKVDITSLTWVTGAENFNRSDLVVDCAWKSSVYGQYKSIYSSTYQGEAYNITRLIYRTASNAYLVNNKAKAGGGSYALYDIPQNKWHSIHSVYGGGTIDGTAYTSSTTQGTATTADAMSLGWDGCNIAFREFTVSANSDGELIPFLDLVPCTDPDGVAGFYDVVGKHFWTTSDPTKISASWPMSETGGSAQFRLRDGIAAQPHLETAPSAAIASFSTDFPAKLDSLTVAINPVQTGTGDPAPDNVRPITGWTGMTVCRMGKNLLDPNTPRSKGNFTSTGNIGSASNTYVFGIPCKPNTHYQLIKTSGHSYRVGLTNDYPKQGVYCNYLATRNTSASTYGFDTGNHKFIALATTTGAETVATDMIVEGSESHSIVPFVGETINIDWTTEAGTVYGGTLDVVSGVLNDLNTVRIVPPLKYSYKDDYTDYYAFSVALYNNGYQYALASKKTSAKCSCLKWGTSGVNTFELSYTLSGYCRNLYLRVPKNATTEAISTNDAFSAYLNSIGFELVYYANPDNANIYNLTPAQVNTLLGQNNLWADTGNTACTYWKHG